jgi:glycosyltransferase involved in cell wall biosynthesis
VADINRLNGPQSGEIVQRSRYAWDRRKVRDGLLSSLHPLWAKRRRPMAFEARPGLTLGIVSRLVPMKQFPELFRILAPLIARVPGVNLEIFGSGGYASVRDLCRALRPIRDRVRFWGHQDDVTSVYSRINFLLAGLPEREGMGRNVIEAQMCGTPVLAVDAPPFAETVLHGVTGYLYTDPRLDGGAGFEMTLQRILRGQEPLQPAAAAAHLRRFTQATFNEAIQRLLAFVSSLPSEAAHSDAPSELTSSLHRAAA